MPQGQQSHKSGLALFALTLLLVGCGGHSAVSVTPHASVNSKPLVIRVRGLAPNRRATVTVTSTDTTGRAWAASAVYLTNRFGNIDTAKAPSLAGSYKGVWRMGLIAMMQPVRHAKGFVFYAWGDSKQTFQLRATQGSRTLTSSFQRELPAVRKAQPTLAADGFIGAYFVPTHATHRPALLVFGGSEGGLKSTFIAASLAANGYPALAIAYFGLPGLPAILADVPLEYFAHALKWLDKQPGVDPAHVFTLGVSRGSEAAQLLAVHYPKLVHGVVAVVPSNLVNCAYPTCSGSAWSLGGIPLPYDPAFGSVPLNNSEGRIPDERIRGPILFLCAGFDEEWPSCDYSRDALDGLQTFAYPHELVEAANAGHGVGSLVPFNPETSMTNAVERLAERGREAVWPQVLAFLARNG